MGPKIRLATVDDAEEISLIYSSFVARMPVSFEQLPPTAAEVAKRIQDITIDYPWLVAEIDHCVAGYAYASQHRARFHYQWSVDFSVYVHEQFRKRGIATALYTVLKRIVPLQGYISAFAGITLPNPASVGLHESMDFTPVGIYRNVGYKLGDWHDVGWWQLALAKPTADPAAPRPLSEVLVDREWTTALTEAARMIQR